MAAQWFDTEDRSVLMDEETRELVGQAVHSGSSWLAYDNDPAKNDGNGAALLGSFADRLAAKRVVGAIIQRASRRHRLSDGTEMLILGEAPRIGDWVCGTREGQDIWLNEQTGAVQAYPPRA